MKFRAYDKPLLHNLELINDWSVFGTLKFNEPTGNNKCLKIWYDFIRQVEYRNQGQWVVKIEGDNTWTQKHMHYLIEERGSKREKQPNIINSINFIISMMSMKSSSYREAMASGSHKVEPYDKERGARYYISKICYNDTVNLNTRGLDSGEHSCWKLSHKLKQRMRQLNENNERACYH